MDTVEWGSVEPTRRRLPSLKYAIPRVGALGLAAGGVLALLGAELLPWGRVRVPAAMLSSPGRPPQLLFNPGAGVSLTQLNNPDIIPYHLILAGLLATIGFGLAGSVGRRRAALGAALGLACGALLVVVELHRSVLHIFDNYPDYSGIPAGGPGTAEWPSVVTGPGSYLAYLSVGLLGASALTAGLWQRGWWQSRMVAGSGSAPQTPVQGEPAETERELTVSGLEPLDEPYFARPDTRAAQHPRAAQNLGSVQKPAR